MKTSEMTRIGPPAAAGTRRLLDLCCGAGGCSVGYARAGFDVVGVDRDPHPDYPYEFVAADVLDVLSDRAFLAGFDAVHVSPPCQGYSTLRHTTSNEHPRLIEPVRAALLAWGGPYVIENVPGAPLINPAVLCGSMFGLGAMCDDGVWRQLRRHRWFESSVWLWLPGEGCDHRGEPVGVYGHGGSNAAARGYQARAGEARAAMGIDWMKHHDVVQAIPPAYTEFLGHQLAAAIEVAA